VNLYFTPMARRGSCTKQLLHAILARTALRAYLLDVVPMNADRLKRITVEEGKCGGRPCIRGLRIRVTDVLELLANGASFEEILADYSFLEREDIYAAIEYAAHQADHTVLQAL